MLAFGRDELFRGRGWGLESDDADTVFMVGSVAMARRGCRDRAIARNERVELTDSGPSGAIARIGQEASGFAAYADDWVGFRAIDVAPEHRRQGLGLAVMDALLEWGAEEGATTAYLQVIGDNEPAIRLYESLGFREHHRYRYLTPR